MDAQAIAAARAAGVGEGGVVSAEAKLAQVIEQARRASEREEEEKSRRVELSATLKREAEEKAREAAREAVARAEMEAATAVAAREAAARREAEAAAEGAATAQVAAAAAAVAAQVEGLVKAGLAANQNGAHETARAKFVAAYGLQKRASTLVSGQPSPIKSLPQSHRTPPCILHPRSSRASLF